MDESRFRRQYHQVEFLDPAVELAPSDEGEMASQLREKIRSQAIRLRNLEQYKILCENRIQEISPGHPIPIKSEHLGSGSNNQLQSELHNARNTIRKLEQQLSAQQVSIGDNMYMPSPNSDIKPDQLRQIYSQIYYKYQQIYKEKTQLEESLRAEMLTSEEQRSYIEVLKQALEGNDYSAKSYNLPMEHRQTNKAETNLQSASLQEQVRQLAEQCQMLLEQREESDQNMQNAADALTYAEEEITALQQEIDDLKLQNEQKDLDLQQYQRVQDQLDKANQRVRNLQQEKEQLLDIVANQQDSPGFPGKSSAKRSSDDMQLETFGENYNEQQREIEQLNEDYQQLQSIYNDLQLEYKYFRKEVDRSYVKKSEVQQENNEDLIQEIENLIHKNQDLTKSYQEISQNYQQAQSKIQELQNNKSQIEQQTTKMSQINVDLIQLQNENSELKMQLSNSSKQQASINRLQEDLKHFKQENEQLQQAIAQKQSKREDFKNQLSQLQQQVLQQQYENNQYKTNYDQAALKVKKLKDQLKGYKDRCQNLEIELQKLKVEYQYIKEKTDQYNDLQQRIAPINDEILAKQQELDILKQQHYQMQIEHSDYKSKAEKFEKSFRSIQIEKEQQVQKLNDTLHHNKELNQALEVANQNYTLCDMKLKNAEVELTELRQRLEELENDTHSQLNTQRVLEQKLNEKEYEIKENEHQLNQENLILKKENVKLKTIQEKNLTRQVNMQQEITQLKNEIESLQQKHNKTLEKFKLVTMDAPLQRENVYEYQSNKQLEEKINLLTRDKKNLELLITKLVNSIPIENLQRVFQDLLTTRTEFEKLEREKIKLENNLLAAEAEMRMKARGRSSEEAVMWRKEVESLRNSLSNCSAQLDLNRKRMSSLEDELKEIENAERRKTIMIEQSDSRVRNLQNQLDNKSKELEQYKLVSMDLSKDLQRSYHDPREDWLNALHGSESLGFSGSPDEDRPLTSIYDKLNQVRSNMTELRYREHYQQNFVHSRCQKHYSFCNL